METRQHKRLHLTQGGRFLGWNESTRAEESFDLLAECRADRETPAADVLARHLAGDGQVTTEAFSRVLGSSSFSATEKSRLEARAKEINGRDVVDLDRTLRFVWSRETPNRSRIVVPNNSWNMEAFGRNSVGLWNHQSGGGPEGGMARWLLVGHKTSSEKSDLIGYPEFATHQTNPRATTVLGLYREGVYSAVSPGFLVGSAEYNEEEDLIVFGSKEKQNELVELSFVPVPRHADALTFALKAGTVELSAVRELITYQLEAAYSDPVQIMETSRLEAWAVKLGVDRRLFVEMTPADVEAYELPGYVEATLEEAPDPEVDLSIAEALRTGNAEDLQAQHGLEPDEDAWGRFIVATATDGDPLADETLRLMAHAAGLQDEAEALGRVMALGESGEETPEDETEENSAGDGEDGAEGSDDSTEGNGFTAEAFAALFEGKLKPIVDSAAKTQGRLVIPAE